MLVLHDRKIKLAIDHEQFKCNIESDIVALYSFNLNLWILFFTYIKCISLNFSNYWSFLYLLWYSVSCLLSAILISNYLKFLISWLHQGMMSTWLMFNIKLSDTQGIFINLTTCSWHDLMWTRKYGSYMHNCCKHTGKNKKQSEYSIEYSPSWTN